MSDITAADTGATTTTSTETTEAADTAATDFSTLADLNLTPEQIKGRLEASRKWEDRAKANADAAKELERVKREALPEQERLIAEAEARATTAASARFAARIVDSEIKAAAAGREVDIDALLEGIDRTRFLGADGEPDTAAITAWVDRIAPKPTETATEVPGIPGFFDFGQGTRPAGSEALNGDPLLAGIQRQLGIR